MTINVVKLDAELRNEGLSIFGVDSDGVIAWDGTPTSGDLTTAAAVIAAHNPVNQIAIDYNLSVADVIDKAITRLAFFEGIVNTAWDTLSIADQNTAMKRIIQEQIYFYQQILATFTTMYEDPP